MKELFPYIKFISQIVPVGSRVTCDPSPTDTDEDYLVLLNETADNLWCFADEISPKWDVDADEAYETIDDEEYGNADDQIMRLEETLSRMR